MDQDIIEKKPSSPVETTLLALAAAFMLGAMVLMGMEIAELSYEQNTSETAASAYSKKQLAGYKQKVKKINLAGHRSAADEDDEE